MLLCDRSSTLFLSSNATTKSSLAPNKSTRLTEESATLFIILSICLEYLNIAMIINTKMHTLGATRKNSIIISVIPKIVIYMPKCQPQLYESSRFFITIKKRTITLKVVSNKSISILISLKNRSNVILIHIILRIRFKCKD